MNGVLVDSNILIDIFTEDPVWYDWSAGTLAELADNHRFYINKIIYAEVSISFTKIETLESALPADYFQRSIIPWEAGFLAGKVFKQYRQAGGNKASPLPDFFIGAHAAVAKLTLLTRDVQPYRHYFKSLDIIAPKNLH